MAARDLEMQEKKEQLKRIEAEVRTLEGKLSDLKRQDLQTMREVSNLEESIGIEGYFRMKENSLAVVVDDNGDGIEDSGNEFTNDDIEPINGQIVRLEESLDAIKDKLAPLVREVKQLKQVNHELENEFDMKKRLYDSAAAGLETELSRRLAELERLRHDISTLQADRFHLETQLLVAQSERDWFATESSPAGAGRLLEKLKEHIERESAVQENLRQREKEMEAKEDYYRKQINMWRDLKALFEIKAKILAEKREEKARNEYLINSNYNHLVL